MHPCFHTRHTPYEFYWQAFVFTRCPQAYLLLFLIIQGAVLIMVVDFSVMDFVRGVDT